MPSPGYKFLYMLGLCVTTGIEQPKPTRHPSKAIVGWCFGARRGAHGLVSICYLTASTHYNSGTLIPERNGLSQFKDDTGRPSVREINLIAYLPLVQPNENHPNLDLNPGRCSRQPVRPSRHCGSASALAL